MKGIYRMFQCLNGIRSDSDGYAQNLSLLPQIYHIQGRLSSPRANFTLRICHKPPPDSGTSGGLWQLTDTCSPVHATQMMIRSESSSGTSRPRLRTAPKHAAHRG